jgi:hypothetical protein
MSIGPTFTSQLKSYENLTASSLPKAVMPKFDVAAPKIVEVFIKRAKAYQEGSPYEERIRG